MPRITRRQLSKTALAAGLFPAFGARAQNAYPAGSTLKFIVGFPAGGAQDIVGRIIADRFAKLWNVTTVVENVAGAGGNIAMERVAKGAPDGTQIMIVPPGLAINQFLYPKLPFDPEKDILPLGLVASVPNLLCVRKDLQVNSVADLVAYAKANPGKLNCASTGIGTTTHLSAELFKRLAKLDFVIIHYRGSAPALNDLLSGAIDMIFDNISSAITHVRGGSLKGLGISTLQRSVQAPEFAPIAAQVAGYETTSWVGVGVRADTPKAICDKIEAGAKDICKDPILIERLQSLVAESVGLGAADFAAYVAAERAKWGKLITDLNIKAG